MNCKRIICSALISGITMAFFPILSYGAQTHKVIPGDTMWKIAVKYQVGTREIINSNSHISNPDLIYPGQILSIPEVDSGVLSFENEVIKLVNEQRVSRGLSKLNSDWELSRVARHKSQDMRINNYFSHNSPVYGTPFQMIKSYGISYRSAAENIAKGQTTPERVVNSWMNSSGHRANILNQSYTHIGVGYEKNGNIWTQMFVQR